MSEQNENLLSDVKRARLQGRSKLEPLLTVDELADYLKIDKRTVHRWLAEGQIPARKIGRQVRFVESEIVKWLDRHPIREIL